MTRILSIAAIILLCFTGSNSQEEHHETEDNPISFEHPQNQTKIFVNPNTNEINAVRPSKVKPTTAQVEFQPGVPPNYSTKPTRPSRPTRKSRPTRGHHNSHTTLPSKLPIDHEEILHPGIFSKPAVIQANDTSYPPGVSPPEPVVVGQEPDRGVVDWFLGLVGIRPNPENPQQPSTEPARGCNTCACGITYKHNRIVGGVETQVNEYPWMCYLMYNNRFYCGASLINNKYLLTAGHCVNGFTKDRLQAVFLDHDRSTTSDTKTFSRRINKILRHRSYGTGGSYNNDIALLQLEEEVPVNGILQPVCLPSTGKSFTGHTGIVTGWGATQAHGQVSNKLREVRVPILSNQDCKNTGYGNRITDNMMCAGYTHGTKDSCQGDSGGPMHVINGSNHVLVGIVSWGEGCAEPNYPGVYTRVNRYISWIISNTKDACYC